VIDVAASARADGTITGWTFDNYNSGPAAIRPTYAIANQRVAFHPSDSPLRQGSYRGLAATANNFAREMHVDELARVVKMDPLAFRLKNLEDERMRAVLQAAAERFGWGKRPASGHGVGIACGFDKGGYIAACAEVAADAASGAVRITRVVAAFDCGAVVNPQGLKSQISGGIVQGIAGRCSRRWSSTTASSVRRSSRSTACRASLNTANRSDPDRSEGSAVDGRGRDADHRHRAGSGRGDLRRHGRAAALASDGARRACVAGCGMRSAECASRRHTLCSVSRTPHPASRHPATRIRGCHHGRRSTPARAHRRRRRQSDMPTTIAGARLEIAATRTELSETIVELEERVSSTVDGVKQKVNVAELVKRHPWPALAAAFVAGVALSSTGADRRAARAAAKAAKRAPDTAKRGASSAARATAAGVAQLASAVVDRITGGDDAQSSAGPTAKTIGALKAQVRDFGAEISRGVGELGGSAPPPREAER
jgi:hypothetical protein